MHVICLSGAPATGKSTLLKRFATIYKTISFDDIMMAYFHTSNVVQALDDYQEDEHTKWSAIDFFISIVTHYANKKGVVLVEGVFGDPFFRHIFLSQLSASNIQCSMLWLKAQTKVCALRNTLRKAHIDSQAVATLTPRLVPPMPDEGFSSLYIVDTTTSTGFTVAYSILAKLVQLHTDTQPSVGNRVSTKIAAWLTSGSNLPTVLMWETMDTPTKDKWRAYFSECLQYTGTGKIPLSPEEGKNNKLSTILMGILC